MGQFLSPVARSGAIAGGVLAVAAVLAGVVWLLGLDGGGGGDEAATRATYRGEGFRFSYPGRWSRIDDARPAGSDEPPGEVAVGLDRANQVDVSENTDALDEDVNDETLREIVAYADDRFTPSAEREGGEVLVRPRPIERAGLPGYELVIASGPGGAEGAGELRIVSLFEGTTVYTVGCRHRSAAPVRVKREVGRGCELVLKSLHASRE